jgi:hypothetical protein
MGACSRHGISFLCFDPRMHGCANWVKFKDKNVTRKHFCYLTYIMFVDEKYQYFITV